MTDLITTTSASIGILERLGKFFGWFKKLGGNKPPIPQKLTFTPQRNLWCPAVVGDKPAMQLLSDWWMMNATPTGVGILRAEVIYWHRWRRRKFNQQQNYMPRPVLPGQLHDLRLLFFTPAAKKEKQDFRAKIYVIDNFNQRHKAGKVKFISHKNPQFPT